MPARDRRWMSWAQTCGVMAFAALLSVSSTASDTPADAQATVPYGTFSETRDAHSNSGVGVGQLACSDFNESARRLKAGADDGLYYAFLAWRDGFVTAATSHDIRLALVSDQADSWLGAYCSHHPTERFANAVAKFVRQIRRA